MRMYLSSYRTDSHLHELSKLLKGRTRAAVIANAQDYKTPEERRMRVMQEQSFLKSIGLEPEEVDLRQYFDNSSTLEDKLREFDLVWVRGGNVFMLRKALAQSGADTIITKLLHEDTIVYGGYSAGVCVLSETLRGIEYCDPEHISAEGYGTKTIWEGLGVLSYSVAPHYKSEHYESERIDDVVAYFIEHHMNFKALKDGQVILINGDKQRILV